MRKYVIEREIPGAGNLSEDELQVISQTSCKIIDSMDSEIRWIHSYVTDDKIYCIYEASGEDAIREHAKQGNFPANSVEEIKAIIDPSTAKA